MRKKRYLLQDLQVVLLCAVLVWFVGCESPGGAQERASGERSGGQEEVLTVFAAASLTDAFQDLAATFEEQHPGVEVRTTFAGSSTVLRQVIEGAPADVFASADQAKMQTAVEEGVISGNPEVFARNHEVVIVPESKPAGIEDFRDLETSGIKLVLAQEGVPAAEYAGEILDKAGSEYGTGFKRDVLSNVVSREADVRAAVNRVALGDADATFGYASDVTPDVRDQVRVIQIPEDFNVTATYPIARLKSSDSPELAREWVDFVLSEKGQRVLAEWGFEPVG